MSTKVKSPDNLPNKPGVYIMRDETDTIIYIGKAKNLVKRVKSYFREKLDRPKTQILMSHFDSLEYIVTNSEKEALILEATLIKKHRPRYNVQLKDDKRYPYVKITSEQFPRLVITRNVTKEGIYYVLKRNGNIYEYDVTKDKNNHYSLINSYVKYDYSDYGSAIVDFNYNGSSTSTFVKTENSYYRMKVTNSEECSKYADVNCKYEMALDEKLTEEYDQILTYNGSTLITKYGKIFNVNN